MSRALDDLEPGVRDTLSEIAHAGPARRLHERRVVVELAADDQRGRLDLWQVVAKVCLHHRVAGAAPVLDRRHLPE